MADLYLKANDNISGLTFGGGVFGSNGNEIVTYNSGVTGVNVDQNVEQVRLADALSSYTFQQQGNQLLIRSSGSTTIVATVTLQNDADGTLITFSNGTAQAKVSSAGLTLGGTTVPSSGAAAITPQPGQFDGGTGTSTPIQSLTLNQDSIVGTSGNDLILANALQDNNANLQNSLQNVDTVDGAAGTDTLRFTDATGATVNSVITNVENIEARFTSNGTLSLKNSSGVQQVSVIGSTSGGTVTNVAGIGTFNVSNDTAGNGISFLDSTAKNVTLNVSQYGSGLVQGYVEVGTTTLESLTLNITNSNTTVDEHPGNPAYKSLTINATGDNFVGFNHTNTVETLTVTGAGALDLGANFQSLKTVAAGAATGDITGLEVDASATSVTLGSGNDDLNVFEASAKNANFNLGAGDDTIEFVDTAPTAGVTVEGGAGSDTIEFQQDDYATVSGYSAADLGRVTGFEVLSITDALLDKAAIDVSKISGVTSFVTDGVVTGGTATVSGVTSGSSVTFDGDIATNNGTLVVNVTNATKAGTADVLTLNIETETSATVTTTIAGVETINLNAAGNDADTVSKFTLALTDDALTTLNISGNDAVTFTSAASQTKLVTIDASANTAGVTLDLDASVAASPVINVKGTTAVDVITLGNDVAVTGNGGNDTFIISAPTTGQTYSSILDGTKGDRLDFGGAGTYTKAGIQLANTAVFQDFLDAATQGGATENVSWFQFNGSTYVVQDSSAATTYQNGVDSIVQVAGLVDLSTASYTGGVLTLG